MVLGSLAIDGSALWVGLVALICTAFLLSSILLITKSPRAMHKRLRIVAVITAGFCLLLFGLQPRWQQTSGNNRAVLITEGTDLAQLDSFVQRNGNTLSLFSLVPASELGKAIPGMKHIPDMEYLREQMSPIGELHVFGYGLFEAEWASSGVMAVVPHFPDLSSGIGYVRWPDRVGLGSEISIQGRLSGNLTEPLLLKLVDPGGKELVANTGPDGAGRFLFRDISRAEGTWIYELILESAGGKVIEREEVRIQVDAPKPMTVLMLESSPDFDTKYLKNWLIDGGHKYVLRSRISKDRFRWEFGNRPERSFDRVDERLLRSFDAVVVDERELSFLDGSERAALTTALRQGLGVLIRPKSTVDLAEKNRLTFLLDPFDLVAIPGLDVRLVVPRLVGGRLQPETAVRADAFELRGRQGLAPLVVDRSDRILAAGYLIGEGTVAMSLIRESYRWVLDGNSNEHAAYWAHLLSRIRREELADPLCFLASPVPYRADHPISVGVLTREKEPRLMVNGVDPVALRQDPFHPERWFGTYWPRTSGWHLLTTAGGGSARFNVATDEQWLTVQRVRRMDATRKAAATSKTANHSAPTTDSVALSPLLLFTVLVVAMTYLWFERKMYAV